MEPNATVQRPPVVCEPRLRVRYAETDQMQVVYHSNYIVWFEVGRVELMRSLGLSYKQFEEAGYGLPVVEVKCRYHRPALYDDMLLIRTHIAEMKPKVMRFAYEVVREADGMVLAVGESTHLVTNSTGKVASLPEQYYAPFREAAGQ